MLENDPDFCVLRQDSQKSVSSTEKKKCLKTISNILRSPHYENWEQISGCQILSMESG